ncbi:16S rRNA (guanine(527)-N(7))-methyltransferase RsmG [Georgenia sp. SUBG003]|uniref:16S rRNA (guanine(527)-N(7))-methyltransferase RsmG n=1 Tax=Georgenia sp. SUBG003 TaxID=1497974 RepID=UPI000A484E70
MLVEEGELRGLIGPRELPRLWTRHIVNSAAVAPFIQDDATVADVGSGAGFPGVVLAIMRPDLNMHLIEPMERRVDWLTDVVEELGIDNVTIVQRATSCTARRRTTWSRPVRSRRSTSSLGGPSRW